MSNPESAISSVDVAKRGKKGPPSTPPSTGRAPPPKPVQPTAAEVAKAASKPGPRVDKTVKEAIGKPPAPAKASGRGRQPIKLKGGKTYAEAKAEAKTNLSNAKDTYRNAKAVLNDAEKTAKAARGERAAAQKAYGAAIGADAGKDENATAKDLGATKTKYVKDTEKAVSDALKAADKAQAAVDKANQKLVDVENAKVEATKLAVPKRAE